MQNKEETMNFEQLREQLIYDEGAVYSIYEDHLGYATFGIGHLVKDEDPEYGKPVGTKVPYARVMECFREDCDIAVRECAILYREDYFEDFPGEVQEILVNMMFNMGRPRLSRFHKMKKAVDSSDWIEAANQMLDSKWARQVPNRANRLIERMKNIQT